MTAMVTALFIVGGSAVMAGLAAAFGFAIVKG